MILHSFNNIILGLLRDRPLYASYLRLVVLRKLMQKYINDSPCQRVKNHYSVCCILHLRNLSGFKL